MITFIAIGCLRKGFSPLPAGIVNQLPARIVKVERVAFCSRHRRLLFARLLFRILIGRCPAIYNIKCNRKQIFLSSSRLCEGQLFFFFPTQPMILSLNHQILLLCRFKSNLHTSAPQTTHATNKTRYVSQNSSPPHDFYCWHSLLPTKGSATEGKTCSRPGKGNRSKSLACFHPQDLISYHQVVPSSAES